jgi:hypothetical protein
MANKNFEIKNGLTVAGTERITAAGAGSLTNLTLSGNLTVQGTTTTLDTANLQVADKNIVLNYHASNDTSSASSGAGITIQDAVNGTTDATILWDASDDEFDFSHAINIPNLKVSGAQGTDGQLLTSTGSGVAWEDAPAGGPIFKTFGTNSIMIGDTTTGTINNADKNVGLGVNVFENLTSGDESVAVGFEAGKGITNQGNNVFVGYRAGKTTTSYANTYIGSNCGELATGSGGIGMGQYAMYQNIGSTTASVGIGQGAMQYKNSIAGEDTAIGHYAMRGVYNSGVQTSGFNNTAIGAYTMQYYTTARYSVAVGNSALGAVTTPYYNTAIGHSAGSAITTGAKNVLIGRYNGNEGGLDIRTGSNNIVISDGDANIRIRIDSDGDVGIGTVTPKNVLDLGSATQGRGLTFSNYSNINSEYSNASLWLSSNLYPNAGTTGYKVGATGNFGAAAVRVHGTGGGGNGGVIQFYVDPAASKNADDAFTPTERMRINHDGYIVFTSTRNEYSMELNSAGNRSGLVLKKPGTSSVMGSLLMLTDETYRLGTASNYHIRMDQAGNTYMGNSATTRFAQNGNLSVNTTTANSGITSGTDVRALGPCFANDANSFTMSQEGSGNTDAYLAARGADGSTRGNIHIGVSVSGGGNFKSGLIVDSEGRSTTPENPAFRARATTGQVLNSGWRVIGYDSLLESRGTGYSTTNGRFTAPVAGWYQFNAQWTANNNSDADGTFALCINGSYTDLVGSVSMPDTGGSYDGHSVSGCCYLDVNDYVDVRRYSSVTTTTRTSNPYGGWFSGFLIG